MKNKTFPLGNCPFIMELPSNAAALCGCEGVPVFICGCEPAKRAERLYCEFRRCCLFTETNAVVLMEDKK